MTWIWIIHDNYPMSMIGEYDRSASPDRFLLRKGIPVSEELGPWNFTFKGSVSRIRKFDDLANNAMIPLVSPRLGDWLRKNAPNDTQLLPAEIRARDGTIDDYCLLNITRKVLSVDKVRSDVINIPGTEAIMKFRKLTLVDNCLDTHVFARCAEYMSYILVSDNAAKAIVEAGMTGLQFKEPSEIRP